MYFYGYPYHVTDSHWRTAYHPKNMVVLHSSEDLNLQVKCLPHLPVAFINRQKAHKYGKVLETGTQQNGKGLCFKTLFHPKLGFKILASAFVKKTLYKTNCVSPPPPHPGQFPSLQLSISEISLEKAEAYSQGWLLTHSLRKRPSYYFRILCN